MPASSSETKRRPFTRAARAEQDSITETNTRNSPFLLLPAELRNEIYKHAFSSNVVRVRAPSSRMPLRGTPALLLTCRQISKEAELLYWSLNTFFTGSSQSFLDHCAGIRHAQLITSLIVHWDGAWFHHDNLWPWNPEEYLSPENHQSWYAMSSSSVKSVPPSAMTSLRYVELVDTWDVGQDYRNTLLDEMKVYLGRADVKFTFTAGMCPKGCDKTDE